MEIVNHKPLDLYGNQTHKEDRSLQTIEPSWDLIVGQSYFLIYSVIRNSNLSDTLVMRRS